MTLSDGIREILEDVMDEVMLENPKYIDDAIKDIKLAVREIVPKHSMKKGGLMYEIQTEFGYNKCIDEITGRLK